MTRAEPGSIHSESSAPHAEALAWLDGVAGRDASCEASKEGARLRDALLDGAETTAPPPWAQIERLAATTPAPLQHLGDSKSTVLQPTGVALDKELLSRPASNQSSFRHRYGWAATIAVCAVLLLTQWPHGRDAEPQFRGANATEATMRVAAPLEAAAALATELRGLGASVNSRQGNGDVFLDIVAPSSAALAVNQRLQLLETGLDVNGKLLLHVLPLEK